MANLQLLYGHAVLLAGFILLTALALRGHSIFVVAPLCALIVLAASGSDPLAGMTGPYMEGFTKYIKDFYFIFALGAAFGKLMEHSGAAAAVARGVMRVIGKRGACLSVVLACAILTYGGVSLFVVGFSVYPMAVILFRQADLPRRFIPAAIAFGSVTFTMTSAGSPEIQNLIPIKFLVDSQTGKPLTDARAGWPVSLIVAAVMFALGQWYLESAIRRDRRNGARFEPRAGDPPLENPAALAARGAGLTASLFPLAVTLLALNALPFWLPRLGELLAGPARQFPPLGPIARMLSAFPEEPTLAIFAGVMAAICSLWRHIPSVGRALGEGFVNGLLAIGATASVVGFGSAFKGLPAFEQLVQWLAHLPMDPLIGAALAVAVIAGLAGSASGGQGLALPLIKPIYVDQLGVAPRALHRVVAIASGSLDTMPANGYLVMLIRNICGETHKQAYWPVCVTCTLIPLAGTALAILLFKLVPAWGMM